MPTESFARKINAIKFDWMQGSVTWQDTLARLRLYVDEAQALQLLRTWAAALGRQIES